MRPNNTIERVQTMKLIKGQKMNAAGHCKPILFNYVNGDILFDLLSFETLCNRQEWNYFIFDTHNQQDWLEDIDDIGHIESIHQSLVFSLAHIEPDEKKIVLIEPDNEQSMSFIGIDRISIDLHEYILGTMVKIYCCDDPERYYTIIARNETADSI